MKDMHLDYADELTTKKLPKLEQIAGRTRQTIHMRTESEEDLVQNATNYCCFWVYQNHPDLPSEWQHRPEYPFDFVSNGKFVKNERNQTD